MDSAKLTTIQWEEILQDKKILSPLGLSIFQVLYTMPEKKSPASKVGEALGRRFESLNLEIGRFAKRISKYYDIDFSERETGEKIYYDLFFFRYQPPSEKSLFTWQLRPELVNALERTGKHKSEIAIPETGRWPFSNTYLFSWNPKTWGWDNIEDQIKAVELNGTAMVRWSCGTTKSMMPNDRAFLIKLGSEPKGIIGSGIVRTLPFIARHFNDETRESNYVDIEFDILLNPEKEPILSFDTLKSSGLSEQNWTPQASGTSVRSHLIDKLEKVWFEFLAVNKIRYNPFIPSEKETFEEGTASQVLQTRYERNPYAREACLAHYGYSCKVCNFNFAETYGEIGKNFIHVHHLNQVATIGKSYKVDPIIDLRPVCPNCHAMIHKHNPPYSIEELVSFLKSH